MWNAVAQADPVLLLEHHWHESIAKAAFPWRPNLLSSGVPLPTPRSSAAARVQGRHCRLCWALAVFSPSLLWFFQKSGQYKPTQALLQKTQLVLTPMAWWGGMMISSEPFPYTDLSVLFNLWLFLQSSLQHAYPEPSKICSPLPRAEPSSAPPGCSTLQCPIICRWFPLIHPLFCATQIKNVEGAALAWMLITSVSSSETCCKSLWASALSQSKSGLGTDSLLSLCLWWSKVPAGCRQPRKRTSLWHPQPSSGTHLWYCSTKSQRAPHHCWLQRLHCSPWRRSGTAALGPAWQAVSHQLLHDGRIVATGKEQRTLLLWQPPAGWLWERCECNQ